MGWGFQAVGDQTHARIHTHTPVYTHTHTHVYTHPRTHVPSGSMRHWSFSRKMPKMVPVEMAASMLLEPSSGSNTATYLGIVVGWLFRWCWLGGGWEEEEGVLVDYLVVAEGGWLVGGGGDALESINF